MALENPTSRAGPPRRARKQTQTTKSHRYEPFTKRIAKLKIDPVHRVQQSRIKESHNDLSRSHFRTALEELSELNLTTTFSSFRDKVSSLCESLPQLLHHADTVVDLLLSHIEKQDSLALEALLSLVAHLAHDLGREFEKYFLRTVAVVAKVSTLQDDPAVIEACFTCLAWMYKYLSRSLVQDLRPLLDTLLPYFSVRKDYVRRFTSEALAFLIRKAAVQYGKNETPLKLAISRVLENHLENAKAWEEDAFTQSCITLLTESAVGTDAGLHSSAPDLFKSIYNLITSENLDSLRGRQVIEGLLVALIHRTDAAGFQPLLETLTSSIEQDIQSALQHATVSRLLLIVVAARGGSRISNWSAVIRLVLQNLSSGKQSTGPEAIKASAAILSFCPLDQLLPFSPKLINAVVHNGEPHQFFSFCETVARLSKSRFQDLLLPQLQTYVVSHWSDDTPSLIVALNDLHDLKCIDRHVGKPGYFAISDSWESSINTALRQSENTEDALQKQYQYLTLARCIDFPKRSDTAMNLAESLKRQIAQVLAMNNQYADLQMRVALGWGLQTLLQLETEQYPIDIEQYVAMEDQAQERLQILPFVEVLGDMAIHFNKYQSQHDISNTLPNRLARNMLSTSISLRKETIRLIQALYPPTVLPWLDQACEVLKEILNTEYSVSNARQLGMLVRRLPHLHKIVPDGHSLSSLIPLFTIGLIPNYHEQLRKELCSALSQMQTSENLETVVMDVIKGWIQAPPVSTSAVTPPADVHDVHTASYECTRLNGVDRAYEQSFVQFEDPQGIIKTRIESAHSILSERSPVDSRTLALQILNEIPSLAEKRSKILVPAFLAAQRGRSGHDLSYLDESQSINTLSPDIEERGWSLRDRKLFLRLIAQFNNPKMLYRAADIRAVLFDLLSNGDAETRKLALLALLRWKDQALQANREALLQVAEDVKTTSELGVMLNAEDNENMMNGTRSEMLPVLLRLVFGQLVGRAGVPGSQEAKRKSLLRLIFRMEDEEIAQFLDILKGRLRDVNSNEIQAIDNTLITTDIISSDQQYGFLRMCLSMLEILQTQLSPFGFRIIDAVMYCTVRASHQIQTAGEGESAPVLLRNIRRAGIQCLNLIFEYCPDLDLKLYMPIIFAELIQPRLSKFVSENAQGVSGLLKMFSIWARSALNSSLLRYQYTSIPKACWGLLGFENAKADVKLFILNNIIGTLLDLSVDDALPCPAARDILRDDLPEILNSISHLLQQNLPKDLLLTATKILQQLVSDDGPVEVKEKIVQLLIQTLHEPSQRLPPHIKAQVLGAIERIAQTSNALVAKGLGNDFFKILASYFDFFRDASNRDTCCRILRILSNEDSELHSIGEICENLNTMSTKNLGEIDYDKQGAAFAQIHALLDAETPAPSFLPVLHNLIYLIRTAEETATRGNALSCLKHFISNLQDEERGKDLRNVLLHAIRKQLTNESETVRADFVELLGAVVKHWESQIPLQDMHALLVGDDEEASFFTNILHIQQHRRNRAMRRLTSQVESGSISAENIADYFLPLLQKFATDDNTSESAQSTKGQSIASITVLLQWLDWTSFRKVFRQYKQLLDQRKEDGKLDIRLLSHAADALSVAMAARNSISDADSPIPHLAKSLPPQEIISQELKTNFIPKLTELSHYKDEGEMSQRLPAAVVAVKLIKLLPEKEIPLLASPIVLDVAQILRSRTQETRDLARNKLAEIVALLGPNSIQFVLKELRSALTRGYQLHVLSFTMHTILLTTTDARKVGDLDYCISDIVRIIFDDVFGVVGQEKDNHDYVSSMKEVKRNKSFDSMEMLAESTSVTHLAKLVLPFESLLAGSLTAKQIRGVDELFRRMGVGISHNPAANTQQILIFAFQLIQSFYHAKPVQPVKPRTNDEKNRERFLIQKDNVDNVGKVTSTTLLYKIAKFALDIARSTFARHSEMMTAEKVHGFVPVIGDALVEGQEDVKISALRLLSTVIRLTLPEFDKNAKLYVIEAVKVVKNSVSTNEEAAQAALKLVAAILREKRSVEVRESDVAYLLKRTMPDLEEPDRQGVTFNFVKAVMARKMQMPEVYELVDQIGMMMVTSQSKSSRDAARSVYVHFLLTYPQGKTRWSKQVKFLIKNLEYEHPEGRQSVMEAINNLYSKLGKGTAQETAAVVFIPLVLRMSNDENLQCREMAGALLSNLFQMTASEYLGPMLEPLREWLEQNGNIALRKLSLQTWSIYFDAIKEGSETDVIMITKEISSILRDASVDADDWEVRFQALELMVTLVMNYPRLMLNSNQRHLWKQVISTLRSSQAWLQQSAAKLIGLFFRDCVVSGSTSLPLVSSQGLRLEESEIDQLLRSQVRVLKHQSTNKDLAQTVGQNILFLGRCIAASEMHVTLKVHTKDLDNENDSSEEDYEDTNDRANGTTTSIPAVQYLVDQATFTLRREPAKQISAVLAPKVSFAILLTNLMPHIRAEALSEASPSVTNLLIPLLHLTSPNTNIPRSADSSFAPTYNSLLEQCQLLLDAIQAKVGDQEYMKYVTSATKIAREKRQERRNKRALDVVAEPERAAREKRRKFEKKKERRKEVKSIHRSNRRKDLGF